MELPDAAPGETPYPTQGAFRTRPVEECREFYDCLIVGSGPAGLSAAVYAARFRRRTLVVDFGEGRSTSHELNENYLGFPEGIASRELRDRGRRQACRFGAEFCEAEVTGARLGEGAFAVIADECELRGRTLILATGVVDAFPAIPGVEEYVGRSLFWCITCDGYRLRDKHIAVIGNDEAAAVTALQFLNFTRDVSLITNRSAGEDELGERERDLEREGIAVHRAEIAGIDGEGGMVRRIRLGDGSEVPVEAMVSQQGSSPNSSLACALGVNVDDAGYVLTDEEQRTSVPLLYAAGDLTRAFAHQVVTAAHEGATAAQAANYDLYAPWQRE